MQHALTFVLNHFGILLNDVFLVLMISWCAHSWALSFLFVLSGSLIFTTNDIFVRLACFSYLFLSNASLIASLLSFLFQHHDSKHDKGGKNCSFWGYNQASPTGYAWKWKWQISYWWIPSEWGKSCCIWACGMHHFGHFHALYQFVKLLLWLLLRFSKLLGGNDFHDDMLVCFLMTD